MHMATDNLEYILTFSSFYKAMYAQEKLQENGIESVLRKVPPELNRSCGQGLYIHERDLESARVILAESGASSKGIFQSVLVDGKRDYRRIH